MKFFRRFRESLIQDNSLRKYLLYATGEIILVVLGILIAVGINNRNERVKQENSRIDLAERVVDQMTIDINTATNVINFQENIAPIYDKILRETPPDQAIQNCKECPFLLMRNLTIANPDPKAKLLISNASLGNDSLSYALRKTESIYESDISILEMLEGFILDKLRENMNYLEATYDWYAVYISTNTCEGECQEFFLKNPRFRNMMAYTELLSAGVYTKELKEFKQSLVEQQKILLDLIEKEIE